MSRDYEDDDVIFDTQWRAMKNALNGNGVIGTGPTLVPGGGLDIDVGAGFVSRAKTVTAIVPGSVTFTTAVTNPKWGAIWVPAGGVPYMKMGLEASRPLMPEPNSWDDILLGGYLITVGLGTILATDIIQMYFITDLQLHIQNVANPHSVTYTQTGGEPADAAIQTHITGTGNPHTPAGIGAEPAFGKNSAFNKNFGVGIANIPEIGTTLVANKNLITDASGKLKTADYLPVSGDIIKIAQVEIPLNSFSVAVSSGTYVTINPITFWINGIAAQFPDIPGCSRRVRFRCNAGFAAGNTLDVRLLWNGGSPMYVATTNNYPDALLSAHANKSFTTNVSLTVQAQISAGSGTVYNAWLEVVWVVN